MVEVVLPHIQAPEVGVTPERDPEHVVGLPLVPVGRRIDICDRLDHRLLALDDRLDPHLSTAQIQQLVGQLEGPLPVHHRDEREVQDAKGLERGREHRWQVLRPYPNQHQVPLDRGVLEPVAVPEAVQVARETGIQIPLRERYGHLGGSLRVGGLLRGAVLLAVRRRLLGGLLLLRLLLELLLDLRGDPADVRLGGGRHTSTLEDVGAFEWPYPFEAGSLALANPRVFTLGQVLVDGTVFVYERGPRPVVADLLVALYLLLERHDPEDERLWTRRTTWHVDIDGYHPVGAHEHRITVQERAARDRAGPHRYYPLGLGHLLVETGHPLGHLGRDGARDDHYVGLPRGGREETGAEAVEVVVGHAGRHHLYGATGQAELQRPERVLAGPVEQLVRARGYEVRLVELLHHTHLRAPFFQA